MKISNQVILFFCLCTLLTNAQQKFADGIICSLKNNEYGLTFITNHWICFTKSGNQNTLMFSKYVDNSWTKPIPAPFSGTFPDEYARFDSKNKRLFFASKRPISNNEIMQANDIWYVELRNNEWSEPIHLGGNFSTKGIDSGAEFSDGTIYFHSDRHGEGIDAVDLYTISFDAPQDSPIKLAISTDKVDGEPYVFNNGKAMLFMSAGHNAVGNSDLFLSLFENNQWQMPMPVDTQGLVNTSAWEYSPVLSPDLSVLYFTRYVDFQADIFQIEVKLLTNEDLKKIAREYKEE